jgi:hypothetical protein
MWLACGNTIVLIAYAYVFFWVPQIASGVLERAREEKAIEIAGWETNFLEGPMIQSPGDRERAKTILAAVGATGPSGRRLTVLSTTKTAGAGAKAALMEIFGEFKIAWE